MAACWKRSWKAACTLVCFRWVVWGLTDRPYGYLRPSEKWQLQRKQIWKRQTVNQVTACVRYARTRLLDWRFTIFKFAFVEATTFRRPLMSSENLNFNKVKTLNNKPSFFNTQTVSKILWRVIAETSLPAAHSFSPSNSPTQNRACLSNISASRAAYMDVQKQYPFETVAVCVLPNHIHAISRLKVS